MDSEVPWMGKYGHKFGINGNSVQIIGSPTEFYNSLLEQAKSSRKRIVLASLYLGCGELEESFVKSLISAARTCRDTCADPLDIQVLLDCNRGSRGMENSRTMLLPLLNEFQGSVNVALYHTPDLRGVLKKTLPDRWNEIVSLAHIKVYIFDDDLIISGANLSESYFTNRQDRYMLIKNVPEIADYYHKLVQSISSMSFQLQSNDTLELHESNTHHPYQNNDKGLSFKKELARRVNRINNYTRQIDDTPSTTTSTLQPSTDNTQPNAASPIDTWVYPLVQMKSVGIQTDSEATELFFTKALSGSKLFLASGYFNLTKHYMDVIINKSKADYRILTASPKANGFYGGQGVSGHVPTAYTYIARQFYRNICRDCQAQRIRLREYTNPGWTFHAKGLWYYLPGQKLPSVTFIGSPNFGYRSVYRDLESQVVLVTRNTQLQKSLHQEQLSLYSHSTEVSKKTFSLPCRKVPLWAVTVTKIIRSFF